MLVVAEHSVRIDCYTRPTFPLRWGMRGAIGLCLMRGASDLDHVGKDVHSHSSSCDITKRA